MSYTCTCGSAEWVIGRTHTVWEIFLITNVDTNGGYEEMEAGNFGDSLATGKWEAIPCATCGASAPPDHPLWAKEEKDERITPGGPACLRAGPAPFPGTFTQKDSIPCQHSLSVANTSKS